MKKIAIVTGGTSGLGLSLIKSLSEQGYLVCSISRDISKMEALEGTTQNVLFFKADVSSKADLDYVFSMLNPILDHLDVLVNNAGIIVPGGIETLEEDAFNRMFNINCMGTFLSSKVFLPLLKKASAPCIVNVSSISSHMAGSSIAYSSCKAALDMMTKSMAKELAKYGIRVNSVNPGIIDTEFQVHNGMMEESDYASFLEDAGKTYPLGIGDANDVSNLIQFLISEKARWITGCNYIIDGGRCLV